MTDGTAGPEATERFELRSPLVVGALVLAAALAIIGAILAVLWQAMEWHLVVLVLGLLLLFAGVVMAGAALVAYQRRRQVVILESTEIVVQSRGAERRVALREVTEVKVSDAGLRLLLAEGRGQPLEVANPGGRGEARFVALMRAVQVRLEADRGYRPLE